MKRKDTEYFIEKSKKIHDNKYDYSMVEYKNNKIKVKIICPEHGIFEQTPDSHYSRGCDKCGGTYKLNTEEFINKSIKIFDNKYDYSLVEYKNNSTKIKIICSEHGVFEQTPSNHLNHKSECPRCAYSIKGELIRLSTKEFIENAKKIHNDKYNYSLVNYNNSHCKIKIICPKHGIFIQKPNSHLSGCGCPTCNTSKGEMLIRNYLKENNIKFKPQKTFKKCNYKYALRFDFYLIDYNLCIEFNGIQHYKPIDFFGGTKTLILNNERFEIKEKFCTDNNIRLLVIRYDENVINKLRDSLNWKTINNT